jgi:hypothetical protein
MMEMMLLPFLILSILLNFVLFGSMVSIYNSKSKFISEKEERAIRRKNKNKK